MLFDLSMSGDGNAAKAALAMRKSYVGICCSDEHVNFLREELTKYVMGLFQKETSMHFQPNFKGGDDTMLVDSEEEEEEEKDQKKKGQKRTRAKTKAKAKPKAKTKSKGKPKKKAKKDAAEDQEEDEEEEDNDEDDEDDNDPEEDEGSGDSM